MPNGGPPAQLALFVISTLILDPSDIFRISSLGFRISRLRPAPPGDTRAELALFDIPGSRQPATGTVLPCAAPVSQRQAPACRWRYQQRHSLAPRTARAKIWLSFSFPPPFLGQERGKLGLFDILRSPSQAREASGDLPAFRRPCRRAGRARRPPDSPNWLCFYGDPHFQPEKTANWLCLARPASHAPPASREAKTPGWS